MSGEMFCHTELGVAGVTGSAVKGPDRTQHQRPGEEAMKILSSQSLVRQVISLLSPRLGSLEGTCVWLAALPRHF